MNDKITAIMQSIKAAAEKAKHAGKAQIMPFETRIAALNEFQVAACPTNILALVEALEKAQRANAAQNDHINQQQDRVDTLEKRNAELGGQLSRYSMSPGQADQGMCESRAARDALGFGKDADDVAPIDLRERIDGMKARITSLESRTVTVKLPEPFKMAKASSGLTYYYADEIDKALADAGINVEAE